ncbi:MAG: enoyl-CoA hydratase/isomerase family protein, partial [Gammaproteobacteria bacterium]
MTEELIQFAVQERIATLTLNRPAKLNALTMAMLDGIDAVLKTIDADPECRVLVVAAAGGKAFSAGADIQAWGPLGPLGMWREWIRRGHQVFERLAGLRQPAIAAIQGIAFGGGLELALACDLRLAADSASFALPETTIGAIPGWGGTQRLPRLIGAARAKQMIFTGARIDAATALQWGLVNEILPAAELLARAQALARQIAANAPIAVQTAKQLIDAAHPSTPGATLEALASAVTAASADAAEG